MNAAVYETWVKVLKDFVHKHHLPIPEGAKFKRDYLKVIQLHKNQYPVRYAVDEMLAAEGIRVIRYPPY